MLTKKLLHFDSLFFNVGVMPKDKASHISKYLPFTLVYNHATGLIEYSKDKDTAEKIKKSHQDSLSSTTFLGKGSFGVERANLIQETLTKALHKPIKQLQFLEVGCADGYLLNRIKLAGAKKCVGYELGQRRNKYIKNIEIHNIDFVPEESNEKFDVVYMNQVFEHIDDPINFLLNCRHCLFKEGMIFLAVPNCEDKLKLGDIEILTHQHSSYFTSNNLRKIMGYAGYTRVNVQISENKSTIFCWGFFDPETTNQSMVLHDDETEKLYYQFCKKVNQLIVYMKTHLKQVNEKNKTIGLYGGGLNLWSMLNTNTTARFFDTDIAKHGLFYPQFSSLVENPKTLKKDPVDELWITPIDYDQVIHDYLLNEIKISKQIKLVSIKNLLTSLSHND
jgi:2-polyprenyl-3-methyl-5-hydroxy-6-metoxy-1,4-benzoquinol methylase